jgi:cellulose synthase/poly-beta-1,6-N-acetylglucosamine synthase-like glycosyltransferase
MPPHISILLKIHFHHHHNDCRRRCSQATAKGVGVVVEDEKLHREIKFCANILMENLQQEKEDFMPFHRLIKSLNIFACAATFPASFFLSLIFICLTIFLFLPFVFLSAFFSSFVFRLFLFPFVSVYVCVSECGKEEIFICAGFKLPPFVLVRFEAHFYGC